MYKTQKLTRDEKNELARQERITKRVAEFRQTVERERAKQVYSDQAAWEADDRQNRNEDGVPVVRVRVIGLYEMVQEYRTAKKDLARGIARVQETLNDAVTRMEINEAPNWSSYLLGGNGVELDMLVEKTRTLAAAIARFAWAIGWYVPEIMPDRETAKREKMLSATVWFDSIDKIWLASVGGQQLLMPDSTVAVAYTDEQAAWIGVMAALGERSDW